MPLSCTGFGHRVKYMYSASQLAPVVHLLAEKKGVTVFYVGEQGQFDRSFADAVRSERHINPEIKIYLVKANMTNGLNRHKEFYESAYDGVIIPEDVLGVHFKRAIGIRNKWMARQADFVISGVLHDEGGAFEAVRYAEGLGKKIISIYDFKDE